MSSQDLQTRPSAPRAAKAHKGIAMEGPIAHWYASIRKPNAEFSQMARKISDVLPAGSDILEVAPGPGYLAIDLARSGYHVVGLDISASFVKIARAKAKEAGVEVEFHQGNASRMPFGDATFDFIVCCAAFKNFSEPVEALEEMHRVLRLGGTALISDLRGDASPADIEAEVQGMGLNAVNRFITRWTFKHFLLKNAYTAASMREMVAKTPFRECDIHEGAVSMEVWLRK